MQFRLTLILSVIIVTGSMTGCAAEEVRSPDEAAAAEAPSAELRGATLSSIVGTWRWSGSGGRIGDIELGEEEFVFRDDGTYAVASKAGDGSAECYEGTFTSTAAEAGHGTILFKSSHVRNEAAALEREVYLDGDDLHFGQGGGTYRRAPALGIRCP